MTTAISDTDYEVDLEHFRDIRRLLRKVGVWWARNVDLPTNPGFDSVEVADEDIHPGLALILDETTRMALDGDERDLQG